MAQTFHQLQKQIEALKAKAEQIRRGEVKEVVAKIKVAIEAYGISRHDLFDEGTGKGSEKRPGVRASASAAKYGDGKGNTWVGLGKRPRWLQEALAAGRKLEDFLGGADSSSTSADAVAESLAVNPVKKKSKSKGGKAKYRDDAGNTWTGFGPRPRWLKDAIAGGKSLEDMRA
jgi:DNA-binding protein H-NS